MNTRYNTLVTELTKILTPHNISVQRCDIFEETLLKAAGIQTQPQSCQFSPGCEHHYETLCIRINGINTQEANKFLNYLKQMTGDQKAQLFANGSNGFEFEVNQRKANKHLLPVFSTQFSSYSQDTIQYYQAKCNRDNDPRVIILNDIVKRATELNSSTITTRALDVLRFVAAPLSSTIKDLRDHLDHGCSGEVSALLSLDSINWQVAKVCKDYPELQKNPTASKLHANLNSFFSKPAVNKEQENTLESNAAARPSMSS